LEPTSEPKPKKNKKGLPAWVTILTLLVVIGGFAGAIWFAYLPKNGIELEPLKADLNAKLTIGTSTRDDAKAWFAAQGNYEVHDVVDTGGTKNGYMVRIPNDSYMKQTEIEITLRFDKAGKLNQVVIFEGKRD